MIKIFTLLVLVISYSYATPQFAKEYGVSCVACHSSVPVLNENGREFLRNGFRFSVDEKTTIDKLKAENNETYIPMAVMFSANYNSISGVKVRPRPFIAGTFTSEDSAYLTIGNGKNIYYQKNINEQNNVLRAGFLSPYTQISSINRISAGTGVNCNDDDTCTIIFKTPIKKASITSIKGIDYSYKLDDTLVAISVGKTQDNNSRKACIDKYDIDYANKTQISASLKHNFNSYNVGVIYGKIKDSELSEYSVISFLDKDFEVISFHISYVYKKDKDFTYQGVENMVSYRYDDELFFKYFLSYDNDEFYNNKSALIGFDKYYKNFIFSTYIGKRNSITEDESLIQSSIKVYF